MTQDKCWMSNYISGLESNYDNVVVSLGMSPCGGIIMITLIRIFFQLAITLGYITFLKKYIQSTWWVK